MSDDAFDDVDDLTAYTQDERAADKVAYSSVADALAVIDAFRNKKPGSWRVFPVLPNGTVSVSVGKSPWISLDRSTVADGLEAIIRDPRSINQSALNLCGPAAFFNIVTGRHPLAVARAGAELFETGRCLLGGLRIAPSSALMSANYADMATKMAQSAPPPSSQAEWMLLGALRNTTNVWWQPSWRGDPDQEIAGMSRPEELASWFRSTGFFTSVVDGGRWATNPGIPNAENLKLYPGMDNAVLINANLLAWMHETRFDNTFILNAFPNHWVTLIGEVYVDVAQENVHFSIWTWGRSMVGRQVPLRAFLDNYYGAVSTSLPSGGR